CSTNDDCASSGGACDPELHVCVVGGEDGGAGGGQGGGSAGGGQGGGGVTCGGVTCEPGQECIGSTCKCTTGSCAGCCDGDTCVDPGRDDKCGANGGACTNCAGS